MTIKFDEAWIGGVKPGDLCYVQTPSDAINRDGGEEYAVLWGSLSDSLDDFSYVKVGDVCVFFVARAIRQSEPYRDDEERSYVYVFVAGRLGWIAFSRLKFGVKLG